ncbi:MAG TPA: MFS transporter [Streptosporangiaceae bacterium]|nr:MFS transporter [Streptosporangiaceae bacterium]
MTATTAEPVSGQRGFSSLIHRQLDYYPNTGARVMFLAITVIATVTLYYELYVGGSVSTVILPNLGMSFTFYVVTVAFGNLIGAFGSLFAGLTDRYGRANLVVFGLLFSGVFVTFVLPAAHSKWPFTIESFVVGLVEGVCLVATPALIRDFSPQVGRATAMGFWTSGPVLGSLIVAIVGSITIPTVITNQRFWTHEYYICGIVGLVVFVVALFGLRELSPQLRDQLMVSMRDRALIEARAKGLDVEALVKNHWRQLIKADVIISALAVSVMLLIYYALVGFLVIFAQTIFHFTVNEANNLGYWCWAFNAGGVILIGMLSDRFRVRKPFMVVGGIGAAVMLVIFLLQSKANATPSFGTIAAILAIMLFFLGVAYTPWMASFTETVEDHNPAAVATGLAIWGWIIRVVVFGSSLLLLVVINTVTPLVDYGGGVNTIATTYPSLVWAGSHPAIVAEATQYTVPLTWAAEHPSIVATAKTYATQAGNAQKFAPELAVIQANQKLFLEAAKYPANKVPGPLAAKLIKAAGGGNKGLQILGTINANQAAIQGVIAAQGPLLTLKPYATQLAALQAVPASVIAAVSPANVQSELAALQKVPAADVAYFKAHAADVVSAGNKSPGQWRTWYWICFGGIVFFLLSIPLLRGRWRPRDAKRDEEEHEAMVQAELAKLGTSEA